jgi:Baseplate J-like protein
METFSTFSPTMLLFHQKPFKHTSRGKKENSLPSAFQGANTMTTRNTHEGTHNTDEIFPPAQDAPIPDGHTTRFIDVHIYDVAPEQDEPPTVESEPAAAPNEDEQEPPEPMQPPRRPLAVLPLVGVAVCVLLVGILSVVFLLPLLTPPEATITIVPISKQITTTSTVTVVAGQTPTAEQIAGRTLSAVTMSQQQTVPTTGKAHQDARAAHGFITFYNAATYSQVIPAGTMVTGADGAQIITEQDALIAAASYPTFGQSTVAAHALATGPAGNIAGGDIYGPCCRLNVSAVNGPFSGGNARTRLSDRHPARYPHRWKQSENELEPERASRLADPGSHG